MSDVSGFPCKFFLLLLLGQLLYLFCQQVLLYISYVSCCLSSLHYACLAAEIAIFVLIRFDFNMAAQESANRIVLAEAIMNRWCRAAYVWAVRPLASKNPGDPVWYYMLAVDGFLWFYPTISGFFSDSISKFYVGSMLLHILCPCLMINFCLLFAVTVEACAHVQINVRCKLSISPLDWNDDQKCIVNLDRWYDIFRRVAAAWRTFENLN